MKNCIFCDEQVRNAAVRCKHCGENISINALRGDGKSKITAGLLAIILGGFGIHMFYLGNKLAGVLYLVFFWTLIPAILGLIQGLSYLGTSDVVWDRRFNS